MFFLSVTAVMAQKEKVKNQPYADLKWFHLGFHVGLHAQDLILTNTGVATNGETWYAEIPSYSPGFSVGVIGDMYLNPYFNLRFTPTIHFGDKKFVFRRPEMEGVEGTDENPVVLHLITKIQLLKIRSNKLLHHGKSIKLGALDNITREKFSKTSGNSLKYISYQ